MPKVPVDYSNTIIYKLINYDCPENVYVGSTTNFIRRKQEHKHSATNTQCTKYNRKVYKMIRENGCWESWNMIEIKKFPCANRREAEAEEDKIMQELKANMNTRKAYMTKEEKKQYTAQQTKLYYETHKDILKEKRKEYTKRNKKMLSEKSKKYTEDNKEILKDKFKKYYEANKDKIALRKAIKITCQCGSTYRKCSKLEHERTNKHKKFMEELDI